MKATYALIPDFIKSQKPFVVKEIIRSHFSSDFHFHNECQLVYVVSGSGKRIIGSSVERFEKGDLTFIGSNVPHVWYSDTRNNPHEPDVSIALYINSEVVIEHFKAFVETQSLVDFFAQSKRGMRFSGKKEEALSNLLNDMILQKEVELLASFCKILQFLMDSEDIIWLNEASLVANFSDNAEGRIKQLMQFIQQNFKTDITLEQAAAVSGLQLHSFCRFFKKLTHRTFSDFLNEMRIGYASQLLHQSDLPITQIAYNSGYANIPYFNRSFKKIHGVTPRIYRQRVQYFS